jgi:ribosomal protein L12E/L44/L45/RPP1/RPP2
MVCSYFWKGCSCLTGGGSRGAVGIEADSERVETLLKEVGGRDISEILAEGLSKLAAVPSGGGGMAVAAAPAAGGGGGGAAAAEEKKEEKKKVTGSAICPSTRDVVFWHFCFPSSAVPVYLVLLSVEILIVLDPQVSIQAADLGVLSRRKRKRRRMMTWASRCSTRSLQPYWPERLGLGFLGTVGHLWRLQRCHVVSFDAMWFLSWSFCRSFLLV